MKFTVLLFSFLMLLIISCKDKVNIPETQFLNETEEKVLVYGKPIDIVKQIDTEETLTIPLKDCMLLGDDSIAIKTDSCSIIATGDKIRLLISKFTEN